MSNVNDIFKSVTHDVRKAVSAAQGSAFELETDLTELVQRREATPKLLTAIMGGEAREVTSRTDSYKYDEKDSTAQIPNGKPYSGYGERITKDVPRQKLFQIPSFGTTGNVAPMDYINRRKPGTIDEFLTEADVQADLIMKNDQAWALLDELGWGTLLTTDQNIVLGGPFTQYNFYTDIVGSARPAAVSMELDQDVNHSALARAEKKALEEELSKSGESATRIVCLCGDTFFEQRLEIEEQTGLGRPLMSDWDFASEEVYTSDWGSVTFRYDWFKGAKDGIYYINYGASIVGTKIIADTAAYMMPLGVEKLTKAAYAPATTRTYANTEALKMYGWSNVDERQGITSIFERNVLFSYVNPRYVRWLVNT